MNVKFSTAYFLAFVNVLGFSLMMPVLPFIVRNYGGKEWVFGLLLALYSGAQFIGAPYLGALSDVRGRKNILLVSQVGKLISWVFMLGALLLPNINIGVLSLPLLIIALARIVDGLTGGSSSVTNAYVSDITSGEQKMRIYGMMGGVAGFGVIIGPGIGGLTAASPLGYIGTALAAILISMIAITMIALYMKESLAPERRRTDFNGKMLDSIFIVRRIRKLAPNRLIKQLFVLKFLFSSLMAFYISTISLYVIDTFDFNQTQIGWFMLAVGLFMSFNQGVISKFVVKKIGAVKTLVLGLFLALVGLVLFKIPNHFPVFIGLYYIFNLGLSLCFPNFNSLIALYGDQDKQGETMGVSESLNALAMTIIPLLSTLVYSYIGGDLYWFATVLPLAALIFVYFSGFATGQSK